MALVKALDVAQDTFGKAHDLKALGYLAVGFYLRSDRASLRMIQGLEQVGIKRFAIWERGNPTEPEYFSPTQAVVDARAAVSFATKIQMPAGSQIFFTVDYDATPDDLARHVWPYFQSVQRMVKDAGYLCSVYGSGMVCESLTIKGMAHAGWLAQSRGWSMYDFFKPRAAIVQGPVALVLGMDVDLDEVRDMRVLF